MDWGLASEFVPVAVLGVGFILGIASRLSGTWAALLGAMVSVALWGLISASSGYDGLEGGAATAFVLVVPLIFAAWNASFWLGRVTSRLARRSRRS
jgi:hypothetical protein